MNSSVVAKWGNSLALRIPHVFAEQLGINADSKVNMSVEDGKLVISRGISLEEMLASLTEGNMPVADDWGTPVGREDFI